MRYRHGGDLTTAPPLTDVRAKAQRAALIQHTGVVLCNCLILIFFFFQ